jgi:triosephosphate isomerase (TIM)
MSRINTVAGNWKMNLLLEEAYTLTSEIEKMVKNELDFNNRTIICPPLIYLNPLKGMISPESPLKIGSQNCYFKDSGAFTGEISPKMLANMGIEYAIVGHSERRTLMGEDNEMVKQKLDAILENKMIPIFCCGESLEVREGGKYLDYISEQILHSLFHLSDDVFKDVIIAYEPIWAIGTGRTASPEQAQEVHAHIRSFISKKMNSSVSENVTILYGGSCNPENASDLFSCQDVDGGLIGGASLKSRAFIDIAKSF